MMALALLRCLLVIGLVALMPQLGGAHASVPAAPKSFVTGDTIRPAANDPSDALPGQPALPLQEGESSLDVGTAGLVAALSPPPLGAVRAMLPPDAQAGPVTCPTPLDRPPKRG